MAAGHSRSCLHYLSFEWISWSWSWLKEVKGAADGGGVSNRNGFGGKCRRVVQPAGQTVTSFRATFQNIPYADVIEAD